MLLACLFKVGALKVDQDEPAVGLVLFDRYLVWLNQFNLAPLFVPDAVHYLSHSQN